MFDMVEVRDKKSRHSQRYLICVAAEHKKQETTKLFFLLLGLIIFLFVSVFFIGLFSNGKIEYCITIFRLKIHFVYIFLFTVALFFYFFRFELKSIETWKERELQELLTYHKSSRF